MLPDLAVPLQDDKFADSHLKTVTLQAAIGVLHLTR
jgi:hypothetical protein